MLAPSLSSLPPLTARLLTDRLVLRPPRPSDVAELRHVLRANEAHLRPWEAISGSAQDPTSLTAVANRVMRLRRDWKRGDSFALLVTTRGAGALEGGNIVGRVTLGGVLRGAFQNAYMGYWIDAGHQGSGLMTEAVRAAFAFAFGAARLHRVQIAIMPRNVRSLRIMERLEVRREGFAEKYLKIAGAWEDHAIFAVTSEEWAARGEPG